MHVFIPIGVTAALQYAIGGGFLVINRFSS